MRQQALMKVNRFKIRRSYIVFEERGEKGFADI